MSNDFEIILAILFLMIAVSYIIASVQSNRCFKKWPIHRTIFWILGVFIVAVAVIGPLAQRAHEDFVAHMIGHLLLGMIAPLLMVISAPMTLILRTLSVRNARRLTWVLRSRAISFFTNPIVASILNIGGLWVLYTTDLYNAMHHNIILHIVVHVHVFFAGYLFTISLIYIDPTPHQHSYLFRTIIFVFALAGHEILSKYIYAFPPIGVPIAQAETGGMLMYYGGDVVDLGIIIILFFHWYRATRPRTMAFNVNR